MNYTQILAALQAEEYLPIYFLHGEESYYIDLIAQYIEKNVLPVAQKDFNQSILYGNDTSLATIVNQAKRYPILAERQVIIIKEAQNISFTAAGSEAMAAFLAYLENPLHSSLLVFCYKNAKVDTRLKVFKQIDKVGLLFESKKLYDNQVSDWIVTYLTRKKTKIDTKASKLLIDSLGNDLSKIAQELDKLLLNLPAEQPITVENIATHIGVSKAFTFFDLQKALGKRDVVKSNQIIQYFAANKKERPAVVLLSTLCDFFSKIFIYSQLQDRSKQSVAAALSVHSFFVAGYQIASQNYKASHCCKIFDYLRTYDLKLKGVESTGRTPEGELLRELIWRILHV